MGSSGEQAATTSPGPLPRGSVAAAEKPGTWSLGLRPEVPERRPSGSEPSPDRTI